MATTTIRHWDELDGPTREELDQRYLRELPQWSEPGLTEEGVQAYLAYRHERGDAAITTYEEGQIRTLLHRYTDPARVPDPVEQEEHIDALEVFGARRLHMTNAQTYLAIMVTLTLAAIVAFLFFVNLV